MHIQEPVENLIFWKMAWTNSGYALETYAMPKTQKNIFQLTLGQVFFSPRLTGLLFLLYDIIRHLRGFMEGLKKLFITIAFITIASLTEIFS